MTRIGIILGSTRPNRNGEQVAKWVYDIARAAATPSTSSSTCATTRCRTWTSRCHPRSASTRTSTPRRGPTRSRQPAATAAY